ncbi:MAG TPA: ABC transporter ATP-binding protein [Nakamurella sp.]|nr:ABC transporter ATP-binding protein [Nakamurella sp.]
MAEPPLLELHDVHAGYSTAQVLRGVDLSVHPGEVHGLLGRNGSGKTTLFRTICGLHPPTLMGGRIRHGGKEIGGRPTFRVARAGVSMVPQGRRLFASLTVRENLQIASRPVADGWNEGTVYELFPRLAERRNQMCGVLSGGEQQMVAIGRALVSNPDTLLLDEPTEGLAPVVQDVILDRLTQLKGTRLAMLLAEQNVDFALGIADRVSVLGDGGTIAWSGRADEMRAQPAMLSDLVGLGAGRP